MTAPFLDTEHFAKTFESINTGYRKEKERKSIEEILDLASQGGDEASFNKSIAQVMQNVGPEKRKFLFDRFQQVADQKVKQRKRVKAEAAGIDPDLPDYVNKFNLEQRAKEKKQTQLNKFLAGRNISDLSDAELVELSRDKDFKDAVGFEFKIRQEKKVKAKEAKDILKLNEELNQQKSRTKAQVEDVVRPYGMLDPISRMITWVGKVGDEKKAEINKKISKLRKKSLSTQKSLYKRYGQPVPEDLEENLEIEIEIEDEEGETGRSSKVEKAVELLKQLLSNQ